MKVKAILRRAAEENTSYRDAVSSNEEINVMSGSVQKHWTSRLEQHQRVQHQIRQSSTTVHGPHHQQQDNTSQRRNTSRPSVARIVQLKRTAIAIQIDTSQDCLKSVEGDGLSQDPSTTAARDRPHDSSSGVPSDTSYDVAMHNKSYDQHKATSRHQRSRLQRREVQLHEAQMVMTSYLSRPSWSCFVRHSEADQEHTAYTMQTSVEGSEAVPKSEQRRRQR